MYLCWLDHNVYVSLAVERKREGERGRAREGGEGPLIRSQVGGRENSNRAILLACYIEAAYGSPLRAFLSFSLSIDASDVPSIISLIRRGPAV